MEGFAADFIWGVASAAYQTEGAWNEDGKGPSIWDAFCHEGGHIAREESGDVAADAYHRLREDVALLKALGVRAYRFSISWPRVFPSGGPPANPAGLRYYDRLVDLLLSAGITPYLTLYHWDLPLALEEKGGWLSRDTACAFAAFAAFIARHFDRRVCHYITLNEPQCFISLGYEQGIHAPGKRLDRGQVLLAMHNALLAHGLAAQALREKSSGPVQTGLASTGRLCYPQADTPAGREAARAATFSLSEQDWTFTHTWFLDAALLGHYPLDAPPALARFATSVPDADWAIIRQPLDFLGLNVYNGKAVDEAGREALKYPGFPRTALKWPLTPEVMHYGCLWLYERYGLPLYITENGQSANDRVFLDGQVHDADRIDFLHRYLSELKKAAQGGVPILGYFHWSFTDNFEWHSGYDERMGLVYVDYPTQKRILKDSARWFSEVIAQNGKNI
ncbi:MAG: GH1 family beta-glucosidase [Candidatus Pelethousia sp.]|nr:GH1 family beta-glucosidase [Candidatus Pelethousia sp.]